MNYKTVKGIFWALALSDENPYKKFQETEKAFTVLTDIFAAKLPDDLKAQDDLYDATSELARTNEIQGFINGLFIGLRLSAEAFTVGPDSMGDPYGRAEA